MLKDIKNLYQLQYGYLADDIKWKYQRVFIAIFSSFVYELYVLFNFACCIIKMCSKRFDVERVTKHFQEILFQRRGGTIRGMPII